MIKRTCHAMPHPKVPLLAIIYLTCGFSGTRAPADDLEIVIVLLSDKQKTQTEHTHEAPSTERPKRQVVELQRGKTVKVTWVTRNAGKSKPLKDVLVHFFIVKEKELGQTEVPKLTQDVTYEGALTMDFIPQETAKWEFGLSLNESGSYLLRVETVGLLQSHGHEHYAALDLDVK